MILLVISIFWNNSSSDNHLNHYKQNLKQIYGKPCRTTKLKVAKTLYNAHIS